jgi:predicted CoA-binding protein
MKEIMGDIDKFLQSPAFGVVGASSNRAKFGNKVLRCYLQHHKKAYPVNPREATIENQSCVAGVKDLPKEVKSLSIITPPLITTQVVKEALLHGIENIWMQPGAESDEAIKMCQEKGINVIAQGPCILVTLGFRE